MACAYCAPDEPCAICLGVTAAAALSPERFSRQVHAGTKVAETALLDKLTAAYAEALASVASDCARRFTVKATRLTAAGNREYADAQFVAPDPAELVPKAKLAAEIEKRTRALREQIVAATVGGILTTAGIDFTVGGIFSRRILDQVGLRARDADLSTRDAIRTIIGRAQDEGWTVPETAGAIKAHIVDLSDSTATQLARTDLIGTSNASGDAAAHMVFEGRADIMKRWVTADDDRVRPTHQDADGQTVPMSHRFNVGGSMLDYPGDPSGPDGEVCNCRCVVTYLEGGGVAAAADPTALAASVWDSLTAAFDPSKHPREPGGTPVGGRWARKGSLTWEQVQDEHPAYSAPGFDWAVAELAWGGDPTWDGNLRPLAFSEEEVSPRDVVFQRYPMSDERAAAVAAKYQADVALPPVLLVQRGGELLTADGHHRLSAAEKLGISVRAVIAHSPLTDKYRGAARVGNDEGNGSGSVTVPA